MNTATAFPWKVDDAYPCSATTLAGETLEFEDLLREGQRIGHGDGEGNVYGPCGIVVRREDGLWIEAEVGPGDVEVGRFLAGHRRRSA